MSIASDGRTNGFGEWAPARRPKTAGDAAASEKAGGIAAAIGDRSATAQDQRPHRPWLVPGAGRL
jgi:hypothetical protein